MMTHHPLNFTGPQGGPYRPLGLLLLAALPLAAWLVPFPDLNSPYHPLYLALEVVQVVVALLVFAIGWYTYMLEPVGSLLLLTSAFLVGGLLDFAFLLALLGQPLGSLSLSPGGTFALAQVSRFVQAVTLLAVAWRAWPDLARPRARYAVLASSLALVALIYWLAMKVYPFLETSRLLGGFLLALSITILLLHLATAGMLRLWRKRRRHALIETSYLLAAVVFLAASAFCFSFSLVLMGHLYKLLAYVLVGRAVLVAGVYLPLARLRQSEADFRTGEARLRLILASAPVIVWVIDRAGIVTLAEGCLSSRREGGLARLNIASEQLVGRSVYTLLASRPAIIAYYERALAGEDVAAVFEVKGLILETRYAPLKDEAGQVTGVLGVAVDVTEQRHTSDVEAALARERQLLRTLIDNIPDYIYAKDADCRIVLSNIWNALAAAGTSPEHILGKTDLDLYTPKLAAQFYADDQEVIRTGRPLINREEPGLDPAGRLRWVLTTKIPLTDEAGQVTGLVGIGRDITERKKMEAELQRLVEQTSHDAETKAMLLDEVNHRVKNNLASIIGLLYAERRHASSAGPDSLPRIIGELITRIEGLATVHSLLSAAYWSPVPLDELARQVIEAAVRVSCPNQAVKVVISPAPIPIIPRQANSLGMLLNELTINSIKYALPGRSAMQISLEASLEDETIRLVFRDDGPGFPDDVLRFERHNVGMYLVQNLVRSDLAGLVELSNEAGAVVTIWFRTTGLKT